MTRNIRIALTAVSAVLIGAGATLLGPPPAQAEGTLYIYGAGTQGETCSGKCSPHYLCCKITIISP